MKNKNHKWRKLKLHSADAAQCVLCGCIKEKIPGCGAVWFYNVGNRTFEGKIPECKTKPAQVLYPVCPTCGEQCDGIKAGVVGWFCANRENQKVLNKYAK